MTVKTLNHGNKVKIKNILEKNSDHSHIEDTIWRHKMMNLCIKFTFWKGEKKKTHVKFFDSSFLGFSSLLIVHKTGKINK